MSKQSNWEGGKIRKEDENANIVANFKDRIPKPQKKKWKRVRNFGFIILVVLLLIVPTAGHPLGNRPIHPNHKPQKDQKVAEPFVAKSHDEEGKAERAELAKDVPGKERDPLVVDQADLYSPQDEARLAKRAAAISDKYDMNFVIVTTAKATLSEDANKSKSSLQWARDYADDFFDYHQYGSHGVLFLISLYPRQVYISTTGNGLPLLNDNRIEHALDEIFKYADLSEGDYAMAPYIFLEQMEINLKKGWDPSNRDSDTNKKLHSVKHITDTELKFALFAGLLIGLLYFTSNRIRYSNNALPQLYNVVKRARLDNQNVEDEFVRTDVQVRRVQTSSGSSGGDGGGGFGGGSSSSHSGSSGVSRGGGGRGF